ncbi:MAG: type II CRISPR-associated endonuclease Cas1 [Oscillospiraceae bacterium]|nr:type II CRISPR-associated endonuclease Cas1 [Oscillospiraceae bacterium]
MAFRNVLIESPARISVKHNQLLIFTDREYSLSVEDISAILLESRMSTITTAALSLLGQSGCALFVCDEKHMPCAVLTPFSQHSRALASAQLQLSASEPLKKRLWQAIVKAKISNQAECLHLCEKESTALSDMSARVRSGDPDNVEAAAAQAYFPLLFGAGFVRRNNDAINAALNYGYAILRGQMARTLSVYGFLPAFGVHHHSELNAFNLADDFMEPFRPVIDLLVYTDDRETELCPEQKKKLFNCLNLDILSGGEHHSVSYAMERLVQSYARSLREKDASLCLPKLLATRPHRYE